MSAASVAQSGTRRGPRHGNHARKFSALSPETKDRIAVSTATALRDAFSSLKSVARCTGLSVQRISAWQTEGRGSPVYDTLCLLQSMVQHPGHRPGAIVALFRSQLHQALLPMTTAELVTRFHRLMEEETERQGVADCRQQAVRRTRDLADLRRRLRDHAAALEELDAVVGELIARGVDPYAEQAS